MEVTVGGIECLFEAEVKRSGNLLSRQLALHGVVFKELPQHRLTVRNVKMF
jgi:hypothetical protein